MYRFDVKINMLKFKLHKTLELKELLMNEKY